MPWLPASAPAQSGSNRHEDNFNAGTHRNWGSFSSSIGNRISEDTFMHEDIMTLQAGGQNKWQFRPRRTLALPQQRLEPSGSKAEAGD